MKIKQLSQETGLTQKTIRYYEAQGLISPQWETKNGKRFRDYSDLDLDDLTHVAALRRAMFTVEEIRSMQEDPDLIPQLLDQYRQRMEALAVETALLAKASRKLEPEACGDFKALADGLEAAARETMAPKHSVEPHFGRFDPEAISEDELRRLKQARNNAYSAMVFYNLTSTAQRIPMGREEAANLYPTPIQRVGIVNALRDDWDSAWESVSEEPASAKSRQRRRNKYLIAALIGLALVVFLAVMTVAIWSKKSSGQAEADLNVLVLRGPAVVEDWQTADHTYLTDKLRATIKDYNASLYVSIISEQPDIFNLGNYHIYGATDDFDLFLVRQEYLQQCLAESPFFLTTSVFLMTDPDVSRWLDGDTSQTYYLLVPRRDGKVGVIARRLNYAFELASALGEPVEPVELDELIEPN